jgi:nucleolar MIF4G domain-containing protein 1
MCRLRRLRATLGDLCTASTSGRWWVVGASWQRDPKTGGDGGEAGAGAGGGSGAGAGASRADDKVSVDAKLLELARQQRMNTDARRQVFVAIMGADDAEGAMERALRLGLKVCVRCLQGVIMHVVLH